jgi:tetratricopeptide (TPR) repeat protein
MIDALPWIIAAITVAVFLPALGNGFVNWDDDVNFLENHNYRGLGLSNLKWMWSTFQMGHYHPLTWMTLGFDYEVWGMNPVGYHLTSVLLHALAAAMAYLAFVQLIRLGRREDEPSQETRYGAAFGALVFALHPLRVESVAWASERRDVLCGVFYLATIWLYLRGRKAASAVTFAAALLSKVIAATLPVVLLILDLYPCRRRLTPKLLLEKLPFFALAVAAVVIGVGRYENGVPGAVGHEYFHGALRIALSLFGLAFYLGKTLAPIGLSGQYVYNADPQPFDTPFVLAAAGFGMLSISALWFRKRCPFLLAALAAYCVTLAPVLSFIRLDRQNYVADHHSYLATLGFAAIAGALLVRRNRPAWVAGSVVAVLGLLSVLQIPVWKDSRTLWTHTIEGMPLSMVAHNNLARVYAAEGDSERAVEEFQRAIAIRPDYAHAHYNLALVLMKRGDLPAAESHFEQAAAGLRSTQTLTDWANCLLRQQRAQEAVELYQEAIHASPGFADAHHNLGVALEYLGHHEAAQQHYRKAAELERRKSG